MTSPAHLSEKASHLVVTLSGSASLSDALLAALREHGVSCGWLRASGTLCDVDLRALDPQRMALGTAHRIAGPVLALSIEGGIGKTHDGLSLSLRGVLARDTDGRLEMLAGEIASARVIALEAFVTVLHDLSLRRAPDPVSGVSLFTPADPPRERAAGWPAAVEASADPKGPGTAGDRGNAWPGAPAVPKRPARPAIDFDTLTPEAGDAVDHFAFGPGEVIKSDGERLHIRIQKDGRIREIALEMLRVTRVEGAGEVRCFRLERRI